MDAFLQSEHKLSTKAEEGTSHLKGVRSGRAPGKGNELCKNTGPGKTMEVGVVEGGCLWLERHEFGSEWYKKKLEIHAKSKLYRTCSL